MTDRELMQQALDALLEVNYDQAYAKEVTALRERLAQPEQEPVAWLPPDPPPECKSEAEKTAFAFGWFKALETQRLAKEEAIYETIIQWDEGGGKRSRRELARRIVALYTAPRQWQGLTEAEKVNVAIDCGCADVAWMDFADAIEAKLKEKNT